MLDPTPRSSRYTTLEVNGLEERSLMSGANIKPWLPEAQAVVSAFNSIYALGIGKVVPKASVPAVTKLFQHALHDRGGVPAVAKNMAHTTFVNYVDFDENNGRTILEVLRIERNRRATEIDYPVELRITNGVYQVFVGARGSDPSVVMLHPGLTPVDGGRFGADLQARLVTDGATLGPVNPTLLGTDVVNKLEALGAPTSAVTLEVAPYVIQISTDGKEMGMLVQLDFNTTGRSDPNATDYFLFVIAHSDGTSTVDASLQPFFFSTHFPLPGGSVAAPFTGTPPIFHP